MRLGARLREEIGDRVRRLGVAIRRDRTKIVAASASAAQTSGGGAGPGRRRQRVGRRRRRRGRRFGGEESGDGRRARRLSPRASVPRGRRGPPAVRRDLDRRAARPGGVSELPAVARFHLIQVKDRGQAAVRHRERSVGVSDVPRARRVVCDHQLVREAEPLAAARRRRRVVRIDERGDGAAQLTADDAATAATAAAASVGVAASATAGAASAGGASAGGASASRQNCAAGRGLDQGGSLERLHLAPGFRRCRRAVPGTTSGRRWRRRRPRPRQSGRCSRSMPPSRRRPPGAPRGHAAGVGRQERQVDVGARWSPARKTQAKRAHEADEQEHLAARRLEVRRDDGVVLGARRPLLARHVPPARPCCAARVRMPASFLFGPSAISMPPNSAAPSASRIGWSDGRASAEHADAHDARPRPAQRHPRRRSPRAAWSVRSCPCSRPLA